MHPKTSPHCHPQFDICARLVSGLERGVYDLQYLPGPSSQWFQLQYTFFTVAGAVPDFHQLPNYSLFHAEAATPCRFSCYPNRDCLFAMKRHFQR